MIRLTFDRFEGPKKQVAVLLTDDGDQINVPKKQLPKGVKSGDILSVSIERDAEATEQVAEQTRVVQEELSRRDPGGTLPRPRAPDRPSYSSPFSIPSPSEPAHRFPYFD